MAVKKKDLIDKLSEMGVTVDDGAKVDELRALFSEDELAALEAEVAELDEAKPKESTIKCVILRDYWDENGDRQPAGTIVDLPAEAAMDGVESGALSRHKDAK